MEFKSYINKNYFDMQRHRYHAEDVLQIDNSYIRLKTDGGKILSICHDQSKISNCSEQYEWLQSLPSKSAIGQFVVLPDSILTGLRYSEVGYVCSPTAINTLESYIRPTKGEKLFKWYFDKTGGISYRLQIGYELACVIEQVHELGYCLVDLCPDKVLLPVDVSEHTQRPEIQLLSADNICSYTHHPQSAGSDLYCDPLVYMGRSSNSTCSDTFSYAVILFELLSTCHPYIGDDCDGLLEEEIVEQVNRGLLDFIDDSEKEQNKSEKFEDTQLFIPEELCPLFHRMFVTGKLFAAKRPTMQEFKEACVSAMQKVMQCDYCNREYPFNEEKQCPFCNHITENVIIAKLTRTITASEKMLLPYDGNKEFTALPPIEELVNSCVIKPGLNKLPKNFFYPYIDSGNSGMGVLIQYSKEKEKIAVRNNFLELGLNIGRKKLLPHSKAETNTQSDNITSTGSPIIVEFPENINPYTEEDYSISASGYGEIKYKWILTIE